MSQSLYDAIGVSPSATQEEIEAACIRLGEEFNPANSPGSLKAAVRFKEIEDAYEILGSSEKRKRYDKEAVKALTGHASASVLGKYRLWLGIGIAALLLLCSFWFLTSRVPNNGQESASTDFVGKLFSIFKSKPGKQVTDAYVALKRLQASTQVGVSIAEYRKILIEAKTALNVLADNPDAKKHRELFKMLSDAMRHYGNAADTLSIAVETAMLFPKKAVLVTDARALAIFVTYSELSAPMEPAMALLKKKNLYAEATDLRPNELTAPMAGGAVFEAHYKQGPGVTPSFGYQAAKIHTMIDSLENNKSSPKPVSAQQTGKSPEPANGKMKFLDIDVAMKHMWQRASKELDSAKQLLGE